VACLVAVRVVHELEAVEVDEQEREPVFRVGSRLLYRCREALFEGASRQGSGQRVDLSASRGLPLVCDGVLEAPDEGHADARAYEGEKLVRLRALEGVGDEPLVQGEFRLQEPDRSEAQQTG